jgi:hypothetical protein
MYYRSQKAVFQIKNKKLKNEKKFFKPIIKIFVVFIKLLFMKDNNEVIDIRIKFAFNNVIYFEEYITILILLLIM